ncbi:MAG: hydroxyacid dehydrogenase [Anaerolineaceae bacterium]|nr:MAG: hydroxyacid dehydrogenase [Anaerolineaceae bacterium]
MRILIASSIYPDAIERLREEHDVVCAFNAKEDVLKDVIVDREVIILRSGVQITAEVMACAPDLKLLLRAGSGFDNIDVDYVNKRGLHLVRIPGPGAKAVAEMSFTFMLALARNLLEADHLTRQGRWAKQQLTGELLTGKRLGIVGAGNIGTQVGKLGVAWGMEVIGCVEPATPEEAARLKAEGIRMTDIEEVLSTSDFITLHVPLNEFTRNLINAQELAMVKPGAYLINLARGGVVNEQALHAALSEGRLAGAGVDVHENEGEGKVSPLAELPNVILTPHIGAGTIDSQREIGDIVINTIRDFEAELANELTAVS